MAPGIFRRLRSASPTGKVISRRRAGLLLLGVLAVTAFLVWPDGDSANDRVPWIAGEECRTSSSSPRFVRACIRQSEAVLIAGESGYLNIDVSLPDADDVAGGSMRWDHDAPEFVLGLTSPPHSCFEFDSQLPEEKPSHHILVRLSAPESDTRVLTAQIKYSLSSRAKAGDHSLWLELFVPLVTEDNEKLLDTGVLCLPFKVDTHLRVKLLMLLVIAAVIFLFIVEWVRVDVVALMTMVLLPELGLLDSSDTFRGLSSNAVVAIIGVMIISFGLNRVGVVGKVTRPLLKLIADSASRLIVVFSSLIAVISSVMQNTGAAVLFLPGIRVAACQKLNVPLSRVLMPIGMAAILGGTLTMVGTSPLILLNDLLPSGMAKFGLLELTPIGVALVICGIAYLSVAARYSLGRDAGKQSHPPAVGDPEGCFSHYEEISGPYELFIPADYQPGSGPQQVVQIRRELEVNIVAMATRAGAEDTAPAPGSIISGAVGLLVFGPNHAVEKFVRDYGLIQRPEPQLFKHSVQEPSVAGTVEVVISPRSSLVGRTIKDISFRNTFGVSPLALHQGEKTYYRRMADRLLASGDTILVHGTWEHLHSLQEYHQNFIIISPFETEFQKPEKAIPALINFSIALTLMLVSSLYFQTRGYNPIPLSVCLMIGAVGMILTRVMTITEAYRAVDWRTVFLLAGLIPLGMAVSQTGTAAWIANGIVGALGKDMSPLLLLFVLAILSCGFTLVISNVGACALLVPLGISMALQTGMDPRVAAIVVGIGVSNSFILPTHQVNALYMGPGEYRTADYIKIGGLLSLIYIVVLVSVTYFLYL